MEAALFLFRKYRQQLHDRDDISNWGFAGC